MAKKRELPKLNLNKETLGQVQAGYWHRTTLRCHETYRLRGCSMPMYETMAGEGCCM